MYQSSVINCDVADWDSEEKFYGAKPLWNPIISYGTPAHKYTLSHIVHNYRWNLKYEQSAKPNETKNESLAGIATWNICVCLHLVLFLMINAIREHLSLNSLSISVKVFQFFFLILKRKRIFLKCNFCFLFYLFTYFVMRLKKTKSIWY